ncbi:MIF4G-domain-containing protein [Bimuria novae-zelandiae CBS 107.79]|uniref:Pre-mRNA-splicing factor CWC22 n=1 Tax=Bimuria novae-zelandiae CBS 107.79 TaxID=1447943 RepID=A0A6A5VCI9_9PLEO|nr:MIF4G-domain-containing protein [Bimuria novae-zelandiae CBS 107.79]
MMEVASAVRIPSPESEPELPEPPRKRDRSPYEAGPSKRSRRTDRDEEDFNRPLGRDRSHDRDRHGDHGNGHRRRENGDSSRQKADQNVPEEDERFKLLQGAFSANRKLPIDDSKTRAGGAYIPPARLRAMQAAITDKKSPEFQRMAWEALKKSIQGLINKCNVANIKQIVPELFSENLIRGRGLFCRAIMKAQAASLPFTNIYAAMVAIVNTKLPQVGDLLVRRLIMQFRKAFRRNDKAVAVASSTFLAHLVNTQVVNEILMAEILLLLLNKPTDDSVEIAVGIMKEVGQFLEEMNAAISNAIFDQFRNILHEADIDKRTQYMIEVLFQVRKDKYKENPAIKEELDLVEEEDQHTHQHHLEDDIKVEDGLNIFKVDPEYDENEEQYKKLKAEILGEEEGSDAEYTDASDEEDEDAEQKAEDVKDQTNADLISLRRTIYLTIKSSGGFEECCHKLMRINLPHGMENELTTMIVECASQERTYEKFYGQIGERFCKINRMWADLFEDGFVHYYETIHRFETNRLRIIAQFFAHLLSTDAISFHVFMAVKLNEEDTTSSSRIFIKILFEELMASLGQKTLVARLKDPMIQDSLTGIFPTDDQVKTRFAINFFTAIGMGVLTEGMREYLKNNAPKPAALPEPESDSESVSSRSSYSSYSSRSRSRSRTPARRRNRSLSSERSYSSRSRSRERTPRKVRDRTRSRSRSSSYSADSRSRSPPPRKRHYSSSRSRSRSRSPPARRRGRSLSDSVSRSRSRSAAPRRRSPGSVSRSRSRSPPPRRRRGSSSPPPRRDAPPAGRGRWDSSSPPPRRRGEEGKGLPERRRAGGRSVERSPPVRRRRGE